MTARLILSPAVITDSDDLFTLRGDPEAMRFWDWPADRDVEETRKVVRGIVVEMNAGEVAYLTARLHNGFFIGLFDLSELGSAQADLGLMVRRSAWGQGYGLEAGQAMIDEARHRRLKGLKARIHAGNHASRRLLQTLGFQSDGRQLAVEVAAGRMVDCEYFVRDL